VHGIHVVVWLLAIACGGMKKEQCSRYGTNGTDKDTAPSKETLQRRKNELKAKAKAKKRSDAKVKKEPNRT
jgi:hypothetical protein